MTRAVTARPHPLEPIAIEAFRQRPKLDRALMAEAFKSDARGACHLKTNKKAARLGMSGDRAYLVVAEDVLGYMESQGKVRQDFLGWYRLVDPVPPPAGDTVS